MKTILRKKATALNQHFQIFLEIAIWIGCSWEISNVYPNYGKLIIKSQSCLHMRRQRRHVQRGRAGGTQFCDARYKVVSIP